MNSTFQGMSERAVSCGRASLAYENNLFLDNAIAVHADFRPRISGHNAFYNNPINYSGELTPNPSDIYTVPMVDDTTTPPRPKSGSPLLGAGYLESTPDFDFSAGLVGGARTLVLSRDQGRAIERWFPSQFEDSGP